MLNLYEVIQLENQIEKIAEENQGEIPDHMLKALVETSVSVPMQLENMAKYIHNLDLKIDMAKTEETRIYEARKRAENHIAKIKEYLTPYIAKHGKQEFGLISLSIRKSQRVDIEDGADIDKKYMKIIPESYRIDKDLIKKDLKVGIKIDGAELNDYDNLQIKVKI